MLIPISDALRKKQEMGLSSRQSVSRNKIADAFLKVADDACTSMYDKGVCATLINNFAKITDSEIGTSFTNQSDFGPYIMEVWPLVTAWYPDFPLKDLISVQDMDKPLAYLFFSMLKTGTGKSETSVGDVVETALGRRNLHGKYPTGEIFGEVIPAAQIVSNKTVLAYSPLNVRVTPGYLEKTIVKVGTDTYKAYNVVDGKVLFKLNGTAQAETVLAIEVATGIVSGTALTGELTVNYVWDLDYANTETIQKVKEQIEMRPMEATPRAIALEWTIFSEYLKKSQFGKDIREDNTKRILNLIYQYQVRYILDEMYMYAEGVETANRGSMTVVGDEATVVIPAGNVYSLEVTNQKVMEQINHIKSAIELQTGRMEGNRMVVGVFFKNWLESLPDNFFKKVATTDNAFLGPREIGTYGTITIYYDPELAADKGFMTYRGAEFYDAAYYLGEYMPIVPTDAIALAVTVRSSFVSMEAYRYDKKQAVQKIVFSQA